jgi:hypothetical protein
MRPFILATLLIASMAVVPAARAQAPAQPPQESPRDMLEDATRKALRAFELMLKAIPQYETPEVLDNGDILIRRKKAKPETPAPGDPGTAKTKT